MVDQFNQDDSISPVLPGKADCMTVRNTNGSKVSKQKRVLVMTIGEAFETFQNDHPDIQIRKSKFAEQRPSHVLLTSKMPHNVCGC